MNNMLSRILTAEQSYPFTDTELKKVMPTNVVLYSDLANYSSVDPLLSKYGSCIILYITKNQADSIYGHWTLLFRRSRSLLEFFDSYGKAPDSGQLSWCLPTPPYLSLLLNRFDGKIIYNTHCLQSKKGDVATCGRMCTIRLAFKDMPIGDFAKMMKGFKGVSPDQLVTLMTLIVK